MTILHTRHKLLSMQKPLNATKNCWNYQIILQNIAKHIKCFICMHQVISHLTEDEDKCHCKHKQHSTCVLRKRCSENMQQIYKRLPMPKCDFNKVALQLYWYHNSAWVFSCIFAACFQNSFS